MATLIYDVNDLQDMNLDLAGDYELANDIDASATSGWHAGAGFIPIGNAGTKFTGTLAFRRHTISDLYINRPATDFVALFGYTDGATITNGILENPNITGNDCIAPVIGRAHGTIVSIIEVINAIVEGDYYVSAFIGLTDNGCTLNKFSSTGSVVSNIAATSYTGALIGGCYDSIVSEGFSTADVTSPGDAVGGLFGYVDPDSIISDGYARGDVTGDDDVGGAIGYTAGAAMIDNLYSTGVVTGNARVGGLIGERSGTPAVVSNCFWDIETSGQAASDGGTGKTTAEMKEKATFSGWSMGISNSDLANGYPFLGWQSGDSLTWYIYATFASSPRETQPVEDKVALEAIRNIEMSAGGRAHIDKSGNFHYDSRLRRR